MAKHLQRELEGLKNRLFSLSAVVEESVRKAVESLEERNARLAEEVIQQDPEIDKMEVSVEEDV